MNCGLRTRDLCKGIITTQPPIVRRESAGEDLTVDGLHFAPEVRSWPLLPHSKNI
jgi:hypothetical protein